MVMILKHIPGRHGEVIWTAAAAGLLCLTASAASEQTACVRCSGPEQVYRCVATAEQPIPDQAVGFFCVSRIASEHSHESCAVQRGAAACDGLSVSYLYDDNAGASPLAADSSGGDNPASHNANGEPATLGEFTKDTVRASAQSAKTAGENLGSAANKAGTATTDAIKNAGNAIGTATKKTLKCLGSALNDC
jgi:hypothetical protein